MTKMFLGLILLVSTALSAFDFAASVDRAVALVDMEKWYRDTAHLASMNRYYRSPGIHLARDWLLAEFASLGLSARAEPIVINGQPGFNVVAEIIGATRPNDIYIVGAHYDSISEQPLRHAPGAEDNASGTAALLAIAQAIVAEKPDATIRFIAFSGEELGLIGSKKYVEQLARTREIEKVRGVLIMDMIGYSGDDDLDALIETSSAHQNLVTLLQASAARYTRGRIETSYRYFGSDHVPFINRGLPAALLIENDYDDYPAYHRSTDVVDNLNMDMARIIIQMATGALGYWTLP